MSDAIGIARIPEVSAGGTHEEKKHANEDRAKDHIPINLSHGVGKTLV